LLDARVSDPKKEEIIGQMEARGWVKAEKGERAAKKSDR